jgi:hypothetical protein
MRLRSLWTNDKSRNAVRCSPSSLPRIPRRPPTPKSNISSKAQPGTEFRYGLQQEVQGAIIRRISGEPLFDHLTCPKTMLKFTDAGGAGAHCESGASRLAQGRTYDWLNEWHHRRRKQEPLATLRAGCRSGIATWHVKFNVPAACNTSDL